MQPSVVCLYLLAMLMFTSTGCALPTGPFSTFKLGSENELQDFDEPSKPSKPSKRPKLSPSPKAYLLDSTGTRRYNSLPWNRERDGINIAAKMSVAKALNSLYAKNKLKVEQNAELGDLLMAKLDWKGTYARVAGQPVTYFEIVTDGFCNPYCLGFVVCATRSGGPFFSPKIGVTDAHGELHYPDKSREGLEMVAFNNGRNYPKGPEDPSELAKFLEFLEDIKEEVKEAKAKNPNSPIKCVEWCHWWHCFTNGA
ncbi:hypothetical protein BDP27DRAFT_1369421 [Rhodocollybia butyracea]|uniref:Uncharacterized protein n=1 Tax=Rhodocollybia butyracea TaxID=206335 RepID=A0A9P5PEB5_9AGAR|nr:hypothetical protein BDP27DRAFT_1369421 [Rhodocollybia butyracea]